MGGPKIVFLIGSIPVSETVVNTWIIMLLLMTFAYVGTRKLDKVPNGLQNFVELVVEGIYGLVKQMMGTDKMNFAPYIGTILLFFWCSNLIPLFALRSPTTDLNTTLTLALVTFVLIHVNSVKARGLKQYLKHYADPFPLMIPIHIVSELSKPVSLGFRIFGNITGGVVIMGLLYGALEFGSEKLHLPIPLLMAGIPAIPHIYFDLFAGTVQAFIFSILTMVFIGNAMETHDDH